MVFTYSNLTLSKYSTAYAESPSGPFDTQVKMEGMLTTYLNLSNLAPVCCALSACVDITTWPKLEPITPGDGVQVVRESQVV